MSYSLFCLYIVLCLSIFFIISLPLNYPSPAPGCMQVRSVLRSKMSPVHFLFFYFPANHNYHHHHLYVVCSKASLVIQPHTWTGSFFNKLSLSVNSVPQYFLSRRNNQRSPHLMHQGGIWYSLWIYASTFKRKLEPFFIFCGLGILFADIRAEMLNTRILEGCMTVFFFRLLKNEGFGMSVTMSLFSVSPSIQQPGQK